MFHLERSMSRVRVISCGIYASAALDWLPFSAPWSVGRSQSMVFTLSAACLNALTKDSLTRCTSGPRAGVPAAKQPRVIRQMLSGDSSGCPAAGGRPRQKIPTCLEALQPQGCCICLGWDVASWISFTGALLSFPLSQNTFMAHWIFGVEIRMSYPMYNLWNRDNNDV